MDAHRYALGQAHPVEGRVDVGDQFAAFRVVAVVDAPGNAFHMALEHFAAHQLHVGLIPDAHVGQLGFLEEAVDPERVHVDHRHLRLADACVVATVHVEVGDIAIHRRPHLGACKVELRRFQLGLGVLVVGQGRVGDVAGVVAVFLGDHQVVHVGAAPGVDLAHLPGGLLRRHQRLRLLDRDLVVLGVDLHQQIALAHQLVVLDRHVHHFAGDIGGDVDDVRAHPAVTGPGGVHVVLPQGTADPQGQGQHEQGGEQAEKLFHCGGLNGRQ